MAFTNSPLVSYTKISPNRTKNRNHAIDTITIHCVVGQCSVETLGNVFAPKSRKASSNYGVGYDGRIGMYCEEKDRSWCTSNAANDHRAITIEVASEKKHPYAITDEAYKALVELCADICKRNNIKELKWKGDKSLIGKVDKQNMTVHRWFANKACPGEYIYRRLGKIASEVNAKLKSESALAKKEESASAKKEDSFLPARGYFKKGDISPNVGKIATFMRKHFPRYTSPLALGNKYGRFLIASITEFQRRTGLEPDGCIGPLTLAKLEAYGFKK